MEPVPGNKLPGYDHTVPPGQRRSARIRPIAVLLLSGTGPVFARIPGDPAPAGCLATIIQSLQDKCALRLIAPPPFRPFAFSLLLGQEGQAHGGCAALVHGADSYVVHLV
jgi:hypothetical protein